MAIYNQVLLYTFRDSLASGDPQKVIFGAYLDGEFGAIHTASLDAVSLSGNNTIAGNNSFTGTNTFSGAGITTTFAGKIVVGAPSSGAAVTINGAAASTLGNSALVVAGSSTTGQSYGAFIAAGTNASDSAFRVQNQAQTTNYFIISGNGSGNLGPSGALGLAWTSAGNVSVAPPSSGTPLVVNMESGNITAIQAAGVSAGDVEILVSSNGTGDAYYRAATLGVTNWSAGNRRSDGAYLIANGVGLATPKITLTTAGNLTVAAPSSGTALSITGANGVPVVSVIGSSGGAGQSFGKKIQAGTNSTDYNIALVNQSNTVNYFQVRGDGAILGGGPVAATLVDMTPDKGSFTATLNGGVTTNPTATVNWVKMGNIVIMDCVAGLTATSNSTANPFITGVPAALVGARNSNFLCSRIMDNSVTITTAGYVVTNVSGQITFAKESLFTAANSKGINAGCSWMYSLA